MPLAPLPIDAVLGDLLAAARDAGTAVLHAPPGAGKTTRVPPALAEAIGAGAGRVVVLEPRRVAARAAARRIADERGWTLGREVGWWIRFERRFVESTRVVFATEGVLLRWLERDPFLDGVGAVVFDEFHERSLAADLALALVRRLRRSARPELVAVAMSATLEAEPLAAWLGAPVVRSEGRLHPVDLRLLERPDDRPLEARVATAVRRALAESEGDVLAFLPGLAEIRRAEAELAPLAARAIDVLPLHGDLPIERQDAALRPGPRRRVVLSTNVAETSVTVEGVRAVVDGGLVRQSRYDPGSGLDRLETVRVSRAAADQRAGRAGREGPGLCLRLWTAADDLALRAHDLPEVRRADLAGAALTLVAAGEGDPRRFEWYEAPEPARLERAIDELVRLGALEPGGAVATPLGRRLARLPLPPRLGLLVVEGDRLGAAGPAALAAALLADRDPLRAEPGAPSSSRSDLVDRVERLDPRRHGALFAARDQILSALEREDAAPARGERAAEALTRAVAAAWLDRLCRRREPGSDRAVMAGGRGVRLARESAVRDAELFVAVRVDAGRAGERAEGLVRMASAVERGWLPAERLVERDELAWDPAARRVVARRTTRFDGLELDAREVPGADAEAASALLVEAAAAAPADALPLEAPEVAGLLARLGFLARARPDLGLPVPGAELLRSLLPALAAGRRSFAELQRADLVAALLETLGPRGRRALDELAPERLEVPSGSRIRVDYSDPERPVLAARIQELFGLAATPRLAGGRVAVLLHLLAPNGRPQQVTHDLESFWSNTYPVVRRELAGRYPKHAWPEDPRSARAERRPRRPRSV